MPAIKEALCIEGDVERVILMFGTHKDAEAVVIRGPSSFQILALPVWGVVKIKEVLGLAHLAQFVNIYIPNDGFVTFFYRFAPKNIAVDTLLNALKADA